MQLSLEEKDMLDGKHGRSTQKAMQILTTLGKIYQAKRMVPVSSVQIAGVSYDNLGEAGLNYLKEMADGGGKVRILTTLNPAGMDIYNQQALGIEDTFTQQQMRVLNAYRRMNVTTTCSCTPYLCGNLPLFGEHIAWAESSAVCFANSVLGARTNREGGPSALAAALTGRTPEYGFHLSEKRKPDLIINVKPKIAGSRDGMQTHIFGALGLVIGKIIERRQRIIVPYIRGIERASLEELKSFCASLATYGSVSLFHLEGITPEANSVSPPADLVNVSEKDILETLSNMASVTLDQVDFLSLGCPHLSIREIERIAGLLQGEKVIKEFWITTSRPIKTIADRMGYTEIIEKSGAKFAADTCCVVAPIKGRFKAMAIDSAKGCYYGYAKNSLATCLLPFDQVVALALGYNRKEVFREI